MTNHYHLVIDTPASQRGVVTARKFTKSRFDAYFEGSDEGRDVRTPRERWKGGGDQQRADKGPRPKLSAYDSSHQLSGLHHTFA